MTPKEKRQEYSINLRMEKGCAKCKAKPRSREYVKAWQFHHIDASTKFKNPSDLYGYRDGIFYPELEKCIILCATCHIMEHVDLDNLGKRR